jgi:hypothetical protein
MIRTLLQKNRIKLRVRDKTHHLSWTSRVPNPPMPVAGPTLAEDPSEVNLNA